MQQPGPNQTAFKRSTVEVNDQNTLNGLGNFRAVLKLASPANSKTLSSAFSTDPEINVLAGKKGVLNSLPFYQRIMVSCFGVIESLIKLIKEHFQPMIVALKCENATLIEQIKLHDDQIKLRDGNMAGVVEENRVLKSRVHDKKIKLENQKKAQAEMAGRLTARIAELEAQRQQPPQRPATTEDFLAVTRAVVSTPLRPLAPPAPQAPGARRFVKARRCMGRPPGSVSSHFFTRNSSAATAGGVRTTASHRRLKGTNPQLEKLIDASALQLLGKRPRPNGSDPRELSKFRASALVAALDKPLRAAVLVVMKPDVEKLIKRRKVYERVMRFQANSVRNKRKSAAARYRACVHMGGTSGSLKAYAGCRRLEREISGSVSGLPTPAEVAKTVREIFDSCTEDFKIYPTQSGHALCLRPVIEAELLNYLTGEPTKRRHVIHSTGFTKAAPFALVEVKHLDRLKGGDSASAATQDAGSAGADSDARKWQDRWTIKITWDGRQVAVDRHQVEVMLLLIPRGVEGQNYNQSCLRIRTVMVLVGKDSQANVQANFEEMLKQASEIAKNGMRYSAEKGTFMGQVQQTRTL